MDGAREIYAAHGWPYDYDDPLFESGARNLLALFARNRLKATFFAIADNLDEPGRREILQEIVRQGHEIACHTLTHPNLTTLTKEQKERELQASREKLERVLGVTVEGFRAPGFLMDRECIEILSRSGYRYDSSAFPHESHSRRLQVPLAALTAPGRPFGENSVMELPLPDYRPSPFPTHPSYALNFGLRYFNWGMQRSLRQGKPFVMLFHLTDVADPLPADRLKSWQQRVFTMSFRSAAKKTAWCQKALELVQAHHRVIPTSALLRELTGTAAKASVA